MKDTKRCWCCKEHKKLNQFTLNKSRHDGISTLCKSCDKKNNIEWRVKNSEAYNAKQYKHIAAHPERHAARGKVAYAIKHGKLIKQPCEICGEIKVHAHHEDYSKPLEVNWLCVTHHEQRHHKTI